MRVTSIALFLLTIATLPRVCVAVATPADLELRTFTGVVVARVQSDLGFRVAGKITERLVNVGEHVSSGQALMRLDPSDVDLGVRPVRHADRRGLLVADNDGIVVATRAEPGQVVTAGQTVIEVAKDGPREAAVNLPDTVRPILGSVAEARLYAHSEPECVAVLRELAQAADPITRTFAARYILVGGKECARLGATITIRLDARSIRAPLSTHSGTLLTQAARRRTR